ncbi:NUMOD4 motif-containing HNH endonuclease [Corynebacterium pseudokroppenstedtii]|uniref:NUMOD4 motif-containing HNH endonuclease n=1 Tax=Corynebacterium pseudokroppenstedtii TaxID=2804917 RepID=A0AAU0PX06_9CORY|nr:NUMOD4 motif-containing HNH endonuclease [Corynebacterium pseudokroppenstedtii]MCF8703308.1 NUMOD4 motif-containing HNH endonuclease [Corynebacterium pseudokroppenstedtii]MCG2636820.1 NUMOD4 motif-containing HNH endonuclease [Corynebacterium pseudokroppenstedtii]
MSKERWRPVIDYEGIYEVSDLGNVRSVDRVVTRSDGRVRSFPSKLLSPGLSGRWKRPLVVFSKNGKPTTFWVHRLVAEAFLGPCPEGMVVCHNNGNLADNRLSNLRYGTRSENMHDRVKRGDHPLAAKKKCIRGHLLDHPNLVPSSVIQGRRACLACSRAWARVRYHPELRANFQTISDQYYAAIIAEKASAA